MTELYTVRMTETATYSIKVPVERVAEILGCEPTAAAIGVALDSEDCDDNLEDAFLDVLLENFDSVEGRSWEVENG